MMRAAEWNKMNPITVVIAPDPTRVRMLVRRGAQDVLKAVLGPAELAHPRAAATLLEGLALWHQCRLGVVLCVWTTRGVEVRWACATRSDSASKTYITRWASPTPRGPAAHSAASVTSAIFGCLI